MATHVKPLHMVWKRGGAERGYHHGNLKEALIRAALELIARERSGRLHFCRCGAFGGGESGGALPALSRSRRIAFRCRQARLREIRAAACESLGRRQARSADRLRAARQSLSRLRARANPPSIRRCSRPAFRSTPVRNFARRAIAPSRWCGGPARRSRALLPNDKRPPALMMALHIWAFSHGIASLFARGDGAKRSLPMTAEDLLEAGVLVYLSGLGLHGKV